MSGEHAPDLVVVGAGIVGLSVAWRAAVEGAHVVVCDATAGRKASWVAAGMLAPVTEARAAEAPLTRLGLRSVRQWPVFAQALADDAGLAGTDDLGFRQEGTLQVAFDEDDRRELSQLASVHAALGLHSEPLSGRECRRLVPALDPQVRAGLMACDDWQVDPRRVLAGLRDALARRGGVLRASAVRVVRWGPGPGAAGAVEGVVLEDGSTISTRTVVLATGTGGPTLELPAEVALPVRPVKGEILRLRPGPVPAPSLPVTVRASVRGHPVYLVPRRDGEVVVGATATEAGSDTSVRAGAALDLLRAAIDLVPGLGELTLAETVAGLRPTTPDNGPLLGPTVLAGLHVALGHFRHGVLLAPVTADAVIGGIATGELLADAAPFHAGRFDPGHHQAPACPGAGVAGHRGAGQGGAG